MEVVRAGLERGLRDTVEARSVPAAVDIFVVFKSFPNPKTATRSRGSSSWR
jgi:hypothetical protein